MSEKHVSQDVVPKEIMQLLDRRATLGSWLEKLGGLRETVRPEVFERVRSDYEERLRRQESELAAHRSEVQAALDARRTRVEELSASREERAAELEEDELRFTVGEFPEAEFKKRKAAHDDGLTELDAELAADGAALDKLEEVAAVLGSLREGGPPVTVAPARTEPPADGTVEAVVRADAEEALEPGDSERAAEAERAAEPAETPEAEVRPEREEAPQPEEPEEPAGADAVAAETPRKSGAEAADSLVVEGDEYSDDLEFLESLSLDDIGSLDGVSALLNEETERKGGEKGSGTSH